MGSHISEIKKNMYSEIAEALTTAMLPQKGEKRKKRLKQREDYL